MKKFCIIRCWQHHERGKWEVEEWIYSTREVAEGICIGYRERYESMECQVVEIEVPDKEEKDA